VTYSTTPSGGQPRTTMVFDLTNAIVDTTDYVGSSVDFQCLSIAFTEVDVMMQNIARLGIGTSSASTPGATEINIRIDFTDGSFEEHLAQAASAGISVWADAGDLLAQIDTWYNKCRGSTGP
jgi:hypothetical protein